MARWVLGGSALLLAPMIGDEKLALVFGYCGTDYRHRLLGGLLREKRELVISVAMHEAQQHAEAARLDRAVVLSEPYPDALREMLEHNR